ncbi:division/cell wall cluster transcriptional repressor MraZ [Candidatus Oscillochloris fontis]|uniref:division/cell wall cluster transcriptional repressor MraZ n=1 Tax=Candidatus Oscillochloris fontis TaxID=2496868 RepID=UPI00101DD92F|nr:division/cell wall cluster transcriptional repressor MraZ [Candidatus Oscillochloris fontis]
MFLGEFEHSIDDKGRVAIPARFREDLSEGMVLTRGFDACLQAFPRSIWQQLAQKVSSLSLGSPEARTLRRMLFSNAAEVEIDRQGRILVPQNLREYAGLAEQVVISGMDTYFEIWATDRWRSVMEQLDTSGAGIAAQLAAVGI